MKRVCPMCVVREAGVVSEKCPLCNGHGVIELGDRAVAFFTPETVSTAIHLAVESQARALAETTTRSQDPVPAILRTLAQLEKAGIIRAPKPRAPASSGATGKHPGPPATIVHRATGHTPTRVDQLMIRAHAYPYAPGARPGARGRPMFSNNWHPSSLACLLDPQPFDTTTQTQTLTRQKRAFDARVLAATLTIPRSRK